MKWIIILGVSFSLFLCQSGFADGCSSSLEAVLRVGRFLESLKPGQRVLVEGAQPEAEIFQKFSDLSLGLILIGRPERPLSRVDFEDVALPIIVSRPVIFRRGRVMKPGLLFGLFKNGDLAVRETINLSENKMGPLLRIKEKSIVEIEGKAR